MEYTHGDRIKIEKEGVEYEGIVMPSTNEHIVLKMSNGYNAGISIENSKITLISKSQKSSLSHASKTFSASNNLPKISILSTGGTIASKIDYRTGAVTANFSADDIVDSIPEIKNIANFSGKAIYNILSENMKAEYWVKLAQAVFQEIQNGAEGIIIAHGTDTMMYTAAALAFMIETPVPIVFVGSQRSADRPSSDNVMNTICAAQVAISDIAEVCVVMHGSESDDICDIHRATKVRKMHTSRRDAFRSINSEPLGFIEYDTGAIHTCLSYNQRSSCNLKLKDSLEPKCALIKFTPGASPDILSYYLDTGYRGIVIEGTGLGHVSSDWIPVIQRAALMQVPIVVTSQCIHGRVCDRVYDTGRDMLKAGVIEGEDMLPEVALVKLMWVLGQSHDMDIVRKLMSENIAGEINLRSLE